MNVPNGASVARNSSSSTRRRRQLSTCSNSTTVTQATCISAVSQPGNGVIVGGSNGSPAGGAISSGSVAKNGDGGTGVGQGTNTVPRDLPFWLSKYNLVWKLSYNATR